MSRVLTVTAVNHGTDYVLTGWKADEIIEASGRGPVWSKLHGGWLLYPRDVPDIVAAAQYRNVAIVGELPPVEVVRDWNASEAAYEQLDLFGGVA